MNREDMKVTAYALVMTVVALAFAGVALFAVVRVIRAAWGP